MLEHSTKEGTRVTIVGLGVNVGLTVAKAVGGVLWHSASLLAEAAHSLSDLFSDFVTLYAYRKARAKPNAEYPFGYAKLEPLGGVIVSGLLVAAGAGIAIHSYELLMSLLQSGAADVIAAHHSHSHAGYADRMNPMALYIMVASVLLKEGMFQWTMRVARKVNSDVLIANAWHHRTDAASSMVALVGVGGAVYGINWLDPIGGILVSGMVIRAGVQSGLPALRELMDAAAPSETIDYVTEVVEKLRGKDKNVCGVGPIRVRKAGPSLYADMQLLVNPYMSISHAHQISENIRHDLLKEITGLREVAIHIDSETHDLTEPSHPTVSTSVIQADIIRDGLRGMEADVKRISHITLHFLKDGISVHAIILPANDGITYHEAKEIAKKVGKNIEGVDGVKYVYVTLEVNGHIAS